MEALDRLKIVPRPCVVLLDLHLARMSGEDFYRRQQSDPALASIPVIAVTAAPPDQRAGLGSIPVIRKPIDLDELRFAIDRVTRSEEHTSELQSRGHLVCRLLLEKQKRQQEYA